ncbi:LysR family transcriptional regulator [Paraburkholderia caribensis]|uniref:LysR family transcriptional regulator n=1 Tax=Paraburkholderia caribensis TaxID=75105 RepID=UPI001CB610C7|nr:LysR family transcriptional regulator [Paraburkholderia caribensis]CAG9269722.1 HTH-type transcriptional regulator CfxR [Paraburkholderia caribensis]
MLKTTTFRQLRTLQTVARVGSISGAAEELHLTQPAVSLQISQFGEAAGTPLLRRVGREVQLTATGEVMARYANEILSLWNEAGEEVAALRGELGGTLRIGAITTAEYLVPPLLVRFTKERPGVKLQFRIGNRDDIVRMLATNEIDLAIMGRQPRELRTGAAAFAKHPMAFVAAPAHPLMQVKPLQLTDLESANLLVRERGSGTRVTVEGLFKEAGLKLRVGSELSSNEAIKQLVEAGLGVAFLSLHACALEMRAGLLATLQVPPTPVERAWHVVHMSERRLPQVANAFREFLIQSGDAAADMTSSPERRKVHARRKAQKS